MYSSRFGLARERLASEHCSQTSTGVELNFELSRNASISVMGRGVFGAIPESGSASESQSQTRGTSKPSCRLVDSESCSYKIELTHLCAKSF